MNTSIYERLYRVYAFPELKALDREQDELLRKFLAITAIPEEKRLDALDFLEMLRMEWGMDAFVLGIRLGEGLATPYEGLNLRESLFNFLAKLDQPVA